MTGGGVKYELKGMYNKKRIAENKKAIAKTRSN